MLTCVFIAGVLTLSNGAEAMPYENVQFMQRRGENVLLHSRTFDMQVSNPTYLAPEVLVQRCAEKAEEEFQRRSE